MRSFIKLSLVLLWGLPLLAVLTIPWLMKWESPRRFLSMLIVKGVNRIIGLRVTLKGDWPGYRPLLLVSNHCSYVDILMLGATLPIAFTPKKEIASWPIIGWCCFLAGCVFVERTPKAIQRTKKEIARCLEMGRVMCIFAEGTTNDGTNLKPFKSSLFSLAEMDGMKVQTLALTYTHIDGKPLDNAGRSSIAWYNDMALMPHIWWLLSHKRVDGSLQLLDLLDPKDYPSRKELCAKSEAVVKQKLDEWHHENVVSGK